jgi:glyoxylase-like metal-dependent hydrolase (beta-lactamase superfamily II)
MKGLPTKGFFGPAIPGHEWLAVPNFAFYIHHPYLNRSLLFDLGLRRDFWNASRLVTKTLRDNGYQISVQKDVRQTLEENGVPGASIEAIIWSHYHIDHIGDPSRFDASTSLVVGPGFNASLFPGYPKNPQSPILESDYIGRQVRALAFDSSGPYVGNFRAIDYFEDGSFYLLDAPGHTTGHLCAFARVTSTPDSYVLMGADAAHHGGELRPSTWLPLPRSIFPHPLMSSQDTACPGELFESLMKTDGIRTTPFYEPVTESHDPGYNQKDTLRTISNIQRLEAQGNVLVIIAHDEHLLNHIDFFPLKLNGFLENGWVQTMRWKFLKDFAKAVGQDDLGGEEDWS